MAEKDNVLSTLNRRQYIKRFIFPLIVFWVILAWGRHDSSGHPLSYFLTPDNQVFWTTLGLAVLVASFTFYRLTAIRRFAATLLSAKGIRLDSNSPLLMEQPPSIRVSIRHGIFMGLGIGVPMGLLGLTVDGGSVSLVTASGRVLFTVIATMAWTIPAALLIRWMVTRQLMAYGQQQ